MNHRFIQYEPASLVVAGLFALAVALSQPPVARADSIIQIRDLAFGPSSITVSQGETVLWANTEDLIPHNVASEVVDGENDGQLFESPFIMPGDGFSYTFAEPGEYAYYCPLHPTMIGVVVVTPAS